MNQMNQHIVSSNRSVRARHTVLAYTAMAMVKGAIPVPAASSMIVLNNAALIHHIQSIYGTAFSLAAVMQSMSTVALANVAGRQLFVEGARAISWGSGLPWGAVLVSGLGATTAALQTAMVGLIATAMAENGGRVLTSDERDTALARLKALLKEAEQRRGQDGSDDDLTPVS